MKKAAPSRRPIVMFLLRCLAYWSVMLWAVSRIPAIERFGIEATIRTLQTIHRLFGQEIVRSGTMLQSRQASIEIVADCSPHLPFLIFAGVVLAFPAAWRQRLLGILFGAVMIHLFNIIRILTLMWIMAWRYSWFDFVHVYLWQTGTVLVVFATFALWLRLLSPRPRPA